jgi:hypothetical protein
LEFESDTSVVAVALCRFRRSEPACGIVAVVPVVPVLSAVPEIAIPGNRVVSYCALADKINETKQIKRRNCGERIIGSQLQ